MKLHPSLLQAKGLHLFRPSRPMLRPRLHYLKPYYLSEPSLRRVEDEMSMLSLSSSEDEGGPGSSGRPLGGGGVSNSILEELRDGRGGVESLKEGAASTGVAAGGEEASESGSSSAVAV